MTASTGRSAVCPGSGTPRARTLAEWFQRRCRPLPWLLSASLLSSGFAPTVSIAAEKKTLIKSPATPKPVARGNTHPANQPAALAAAEDAALHGSDVPAYDTAKVKLNYFGASWDKVIPELAEATGSRLIADRFPPGRYSRRDAMEYSRAEAVRIINREIEPTGYRLVEKGQFLILLDVPSQRPRYQPAVVPPPSSIDQTTPGLSEVPQRFQRSVTAVKPVPRAGEEGMPTAGGTGSVAAASGRATPAAIPPTDLEAQAAQRTAAGRNRWPTTAPGGIRQVNHEEPAAGLPHVLDDSAAKASEPLTVVVFRARNQRVTDLAKRVYRAFKPRAELVDAGRDGLPAFRVRSQSIAAEQPNNPVLFSMAIDEQREELLIDARATDADAVLKLLRRLDTTELDGQPLHLVATTKTACLAAEQLPPEIGRLRAQRAKAAPQRLPADVGGPDHAGGVRPLGAAAEALDADDVRFAQGEELPRGDRPANPAANAAQPGQRMERVPVDKLPGPLGDALGTLKGEVNIEAVSDLGVLILRGNEKDVEQVMKVIRELERLSEATAPQVHILNLKNVNSEALAELLTTVYESLTKFPGKATQPRQNVVIIPVSKPNSILIVAPQADLESILDLAEVLDTPVEPETEFQVFHLQTAIAPRVETMLNEFYAERKGLGARVIVRSDIRANALIVQAKPRDLDEVAALIRKIDRDETGAINQLQIFPLKNAVAAELSAVLNAAIQSVLSPPSNAGANQAFGGQGAGLGNAQVADEFRDVRSTVLQFLATDSGGERKLKSGILADIRITPDPRMNALVVSAPEASMTLITELIKHLDRPTGQVAEIKVFTMANADAQLMVTQLQGLFGQSGQGNQNRQQIGVQVAGAEDASSGLIPLRFSVDTRTNSVIAIGAADALRVVEAIILRLDESDLRERQNSVYRLKNSPAAQIATSVTQFLGSQQDLAQQDPNLVSNVEQLEREVIVVAEPVSNSLLISATPRYYTEVMALIKKLDEAPQQVIIQAMLVEVELQDTDELGVELGFQDSILFDRSLVSGLTQISETTTSPNGVQTTTQTVISQQGSPGYLFGNPATPLGNNTTKNVNSGRVGSQGLSNFSVGRVNGDLGFGGLVLSASSESVSMLLRALSANRQARVLSRPQIRTLDNQTASIQQGQNVPIVQGVTLAATGIANPNVARDDAGVILTVTPRISPDSNIVMELVAEKSQYNLANGVPIFTDTATGNVVTSPIKDISVARTTVSIPSGQTIVLGGLITSRVDEAHRKVPVIGDIPIIGWAFRYDFLQTRRTELLIFLTPRIVTDDSESEHIKEVEMARMHFLESEAEEMHGPLRGVPASELGNEPWLLQSPTGAFPVSPTTAPDGTLPGTLPPMPATTMPAANPAQPNGPAALPLDVTPPATPSPSTAPQPTSSKARPEAVPAVPRSEVQTPPPPPESAQRSSRTRDPNVMPAAGSVKLNDLEPNASGSAQSAVKPPLTPTDDRKASRAITPAKKTSTANPLKLSRGPFSPVPVTSK